MLTDTKANKAKKQDKPYKLVDAAGLYLEVRPSGKKFWRLRYYIHQKEGIYTIGEYPHISLAAARAERDHVKQLAKQGLNPNTVKKQQQLEARIERGNTFRDIAQQYRERQEAEWSAKYLAQFDRIMNNEVYPVIGDMALVEIKPAFILAILQPIVDRDALSVARVCRQLISKVFSLAAAKLLVDYDPTSLLKEAIPSRKVTHHIPLPITMISTVFKKLDGYQGQQAALGIKLLLHTFLRSNELRLAQWKEVDFERKLWIVPAEHTKRRRDHLVPLTAQSIQLLQELAATYGSDPEAHILPSQLYPGQPIHNRTLGKALTVLGFKGQFTLHGFRSTASTTLNDQGWHTDAIERQLNHAEQKAERRAYNRAQYLDIRIEMMAWWSDFIEKHAKVNLPPL